jgi:hypothetical protein
MARKLSLAQLAKKIGTDKALAAYITAHGELPKNRFSLADMTTVTYQLSYFPEIREQVTAHIVSQTKGSFGRWCAVVEAYYNSALISRDDEQRILRHALQQCVNQASSFNHWYRLYDFRHLGNEELEDYVLAQMAETAQTFSQLEKALNFGAGNEANLRRKIITKLKECATWAQWLKVLEGNYDSRQETRKPICEAALQELLAQVSGFSEVEKILEALPGHMCSAQKQKQLVLELAEHAQTRKQWEIVQTKASMLHLRTVQRKAAVALLPFQRTFNDWRRFFSTNRDQAKLRIENMRRLAKTFKQWLELYSFATNARRDLEKMREIGTIADWNSFYISVYDQKKGGLLNARNEANAAFLK